MHIKKWLNGLGGTRDGYIQERLDEWRFHHDYLRQDSHDDNFFKMLRVLKLQGWQAKIEVDASLQENERRRRREREEAEREADSDYDDDDD